MARMREVSGKAAKRILKIVGGVILVAAVVVAVWLGPVLKAFYDKGFFDAQEKRAWTATSRENLKALHTAMLLYHDSEGQFPDASGWMDALVSRIKTADLADEEAFKKFRNPTIQPGGDRVFGYAMSRAASAKYKDDLPKDAVLLFDSQTTEWNAQGDPVKDGANPPRAGGNLGITVNGEIVDLK